MSPNKDFRPVSMVVLLAFLFLRFLAPLSANPFLGGQPEGTPEAPKVSAPSPAPQIFLDWQKTFRDTTADLIGQWQDSPGWAVIIFRGSKAEKRP